MAAQLLFYEAAVPVTVARHGDWSIEPRDYSFSRGINAVPLTTVEFQAAAGEYTIVFTGEPGAIMPAAILGVRPSENLYLTNQGQWDAPYVPAFVRRYPFVFSSIDEGKTFTLCIDEGFPGFNQAGRGQRLFGEDGKASAYTGTVLEFLQRYQLEFQRTQEFCRRLEQLELFEPMQARVGLPSGERLGLDGFVGVNRARLKALAPAQVADLVRDDAIELVYLHLLSMHNFHRLADRVAGAARPDPAADAQAAATPAKRTAAKARKRVEGKQPS